MNEVLAQLRPSQPPPSHSWPNAAKILAACESAPHEATGALTVRTRALSGTVFIEAGRICWIAASGLDRRLGHLLRERAHALSSETLEDVYRFCVQSGTPFGEALVESGMLTEDELRGALEQHTVESLMLLSNEPVDELVWVPRTARNYDAKFTFTPAGLLETVGRTAHPELHVVAREHLARMLRGGGAGAGFVADDREGAHCVALHNARWPVETVLEIGRRVLIAHSLVDVVYERPRCFVMAQPLGGSVAVWRFGGVVFASVGRDGAVLPMKLVGLETALSVLDSGVSRSDT